MSDYSRDWRDQADLRMKELSAEVERLRAENVTFRNCADDLGVRIEQYAAQVAKLEAENAELRKDLEWAQRSAHAHATDTRLDVLRNKNEALKAGLAWFVKRESEHLEWMREHLHPELDRGAFASRMAAMWLWEAENPKPSGGT